MKKMMESMMYKKSGKGKSSGEGYEHKSKMKRGMNKSKRMGPPQLSKFK